MRGALTPDLVLSVVFHWVATCGSLTPPTSFWETIRSPVRVLELAVVVAAIVEVVVEEVVVATVRFHTWLLALHRVAAQDNETSATIELADQSPRAHHSSIDAHDRLRSSPLSSRQSALCAHASLSLWRIARLPQPCQTGGFVCNPVLGHD